MTRLTLDLLATVTKNSSKFADNLHLGAQRHNSGYLLYDLISESSPAAHDSEYSEKIY